MIGMFLSDVNDYFTNWATLSLNKVSLWDFKYNMGIFFQIFYLG